MTPPGVIRIIGKKEEIIPKIVEGSIKKFKTEMVLMNQPYIRDESITVQDLINENVVSLRENIVVRRFTRYERGEGIEKRKDDLAAEIAAMAKK